MPGTSWRSGWPEAGPGWPGMTPEEPPTRGLLALAQIFRRRRHAPDVARTFPHLRLLRPVAVPGPRIEITEVLVEHLVELGEQLDDLVVRIAVIGVDVV